MSTLLFPIIDELFISGSSLAITVLALYPHSLGAREIKRALPFKLYLEKSKGKID